MFDIEYKGAGSVVINTKKIKLVTDPKLSLVGLKDLSVKNAVQILTEDRFETSDDSRMIFRGPGEYEIGDAGMYGFATQRHLDSEDQGRQSTSYRITVGGVKILLLANVAPKLSEDQLEDIGVVDVVIVPVGGGGYTLDATSATAIIRQLDPKAVVPVHYAESGLNYEVPQDDLDTFVKEVGAPIIEAGPKWKIRNANALPEQLSIIKVARS